jgi:hypothetical protein
MTRKGLAAAAGGSLFAGAALFDLISPQPPSKTAFDGVTIRGEPSALSIVSEASFVQCFLTLNRRFTAPAQLAAGKTLVAWSRFVTEGEVRFDPVLHVPDTLKIECLNPEVRTGFFRFPR